MTIVASGSPINKGWEGYDNPSLPIGAWEFDLGVTGDASGGVREVDIVFKESGAPLSALAYSIEHLSLQDLDNTTQNVSLFTSGFVLLKQLLLSVGTFSPGNFASSNQLIARGIPLFLGQIQPVAGGGAIVHIQINNDDLELFNVRAEGYTWSQRSILARGGYQKPLTSPWNR